MNKIPLRFTTLHFEQRFLIEDDTFMIATPSQYSQSINYTSSGFLRPDILGHG